VLARSETLFGVIKVAQVRGRDDDQLDLVVAGDLFQSVDDFQPLDPREIPSGRLGQGSRSLEHRVKREEFRVGGDEGIVEGLQRETCGGGNEVEV